MNTRTGNPAASAHTPIPQPSRLALGLGPLLVLGLFLLFAGWTGENESNAAAAAWTLIHSVGWPMTWLAAACGFGWPLRLLLARESRDGVALQIALGIAAMLWIDQILGGLGAGQFAGKIGAIAAIAAGCAILALQFGFSIKRRTRIEPPAWPLWTAAPCVAVLLLAACSAPGWLWATEFGGYDALAYHLQLPKEWLALGRIQPLNHNVYSYLPGSMEAAYYHLWALNSGNIDAVYDCQLLHALVTLIAAGLIGRTAFRVTNSPLASSIACVLALGTPWITVAGSLAYNEMAVALMLAAGVLAMNDDMLGLFRRSALVGLFTAAACAAKLTALGLVAIPLALVLIVRTPPRAWWKAIIAGGLAGVIILMPYFVRNAVYSGNPVFPFATSVFGFGHWTAEQAQIWSYGHQAHVNLIERLTELWDQFLRYGIGPNPHPSIEPWKPQWLILPWLGLGGLVIGAFSRDRVRRRWAIALLIVVLAQIAFWMLFTHLKSRFLVPAVVPLALGASIGVAAMERHIRFRSVRFDRGMTAGLALFALAWGCGSAWIFHSERSGAPAAAVGSAHVFAGEDLTPPQRAELAALSSAVVINTELAAHDRVLMVGDATPLYLRDFSRIAYQTTWDRGPLSRIMTAHPDDPAQWLRSLREEGFTHLLIDPDMLRRWEKAEWNDPRITADRIMSMAETHGRIVRRFARPQGKALYRLNERSSAEGGQTGLGDQEPEGSRHSHILKNVRTSPLSGGLSQSSSNLVHTQTSRDRQGAVDRPLADVRGSFGIRICRAKEKSPP